MGKFDGVLLISDYDDTLTTDSGYVSPENIAAVERFVAEGGLFTICTGRAHRTFTPHLHETPVNAPVILSGGAVLYDYEKDAPVLELPLPLTAVEDLSVLSRAMPHVGIETYHGDDVYIHAPNDYTRRHMEKVKTTWTPCLLEEMPTPWIKAVLQSDQAELRKAQAFLLERWGERYEAIFSNSVLLEVTAKGANKGAMVERLARRLGIEKKHLYCAGNNQNDIPMLAVAGEAFAPADCAEEVISWGRATVVRPYVDSAIAHIISLLEQRYN